MLEDFSKAEVELFHYGGFSDFGSIFSAKAKYNKVQSKLKNNKYKISYEVADFGEFAERIKEKFDLILLSNVGDYYIDSHSGLEFRKIVSNLYYEKLNENGVMQVSSSVSKGLSVFDAMYANGGLYEDIDVENGFLKEYTGLHGQVGSLLLKKQAAQNLEQKEREI